MSDIESQDIINFTRFPENQILENKIKFCNCVGSTKIGVFESLKNHGIQPKHIIFNYIIFSDFNNQPGQLANSKLT